MSKKLKKTKITDIFGYVVGCECKEKEIKVIKSEKKIVDKIIINNHYSKKACKNSCYALLVYYINIISGALQVGYGIKPKNKGKYDHKEVREFDRMWLNDTMPKYSETITISLLHKYIKSINKDIKYLISYCDTSVGNKGTIYKASNYKLIDQLKADFYILENGERVHPITMWHRHKTRAWEFLTKEYKGIKKAKGLQLKFIFKLRR